MMDVLNLRIRYRPLRLGLCVSQGDLQGFRFAVKLASTMWGGKFNPIIPVTEDHALSNALVSAFRIDALYPVSNSKPVSAFAESVGHLKWPNHERALFVRRQNSVDATFLDIFHPIRHLQRRPPSADRNFRPFYLNWAEDDPLNHVLLATFGDFPSREDVGKDYLSLFRGLEPTEISVAKTEIVAVDGRRMITPIELTALELFPRRVGWGHKDPGFYVGSASDFTDLVNFWNLQAANIKLVFYDPEFTERLRPITEAQKKWLLGRPKRDPEWPYHSSIWTKTRQPLPDLVPFGDGFAISVADEHLWNSGSMWRPPSVGFEEQSVLGTVSRQFDRPSTTFQLPSKPFFSHSSLYEQQVVASVRPLIQSPELILRPPYMPELNEYYGREIHFDSQKARSEPDGVGLIIGVTHSDLTLRALDSNRLIEQIFASRGAKAAPSDAGKIGGRLIQQMGGLQSCRVFKIPGVRELIRKYPPLDSFTRSGAIQIIRGEDAATKASSFKPHDGLYIGYRSGGTLKPEDAFSYLLEKKMFRAGLSFVCPNCALEFWLHLDSAKTICACEYCDTSFNVMTQLRDRDWRFRRTGLFGREDNQAGGIPVSVVLQQLDTIVHHKMVAWTTGMNVAVTSQGNWKCESDFVAIVEDHDGPQVVISEVKSFGGEITEADSTNLARLADLFEGSSLTPYVVFGKLGAFSPEEVERCKKAQYARRSRVILLSDRELEPYFVYERTEKEFDIRGSAINLKDLATATISIFFEPRPKTSA